MGVTTVRLDDNLIDELNSFAKKERVDRSTVLKKALEMGLKEIKLEDALKAYQKGKISAWKAAELAGISLWEFLDILEKRDIGFRTAEPELEEMLGEI